MYKRSPPAPPLRYRLIATPLTKSKIPTFLDNKFLVKKKKQNHYQLEKVNKTRYARIKQIVAGKIYWKRICMFRKIEIECAFCVVTIQLVV